MNFLRIKGYLSIQSLDETKLDTALEKYFSLSYDQLSLRFASGFLVGLGEERNGDISLLDCLTGYTPKLLPEPEKGTGEVNLSAKDKLRAGKKTKKSAKGGGASKKLITSVKLPTVCTPSEDKPWGKIYTITCLSLSSAVTIASILVPVIKPSTASFSRVVSSLDIDLDVLCQVDVQMSVYEVAGLVRTSMKEQIKISYENLRSLNLSTGIAKAVHCYTKSLSIPITLVHIVDVTGVDSSPPCLVSLTDRDQGAADRRRVLHLAHGLPTDRPLLLLQCAEVFHSEFDIQSTEGEQASSCSTHNKLRNVHIGLPSTGIPGGSQFLVQGDYQYFHYLQDQINDKGWGCAYRSLQTVVSWYRLNHYTSQQVPSHADIQRALVNIGDKPSSFIGSSEWIGSMEVGFYLDSQLNISWRNISVTNGPDLTSKARELATHFQEHGTPIMMGGGNLAFTLLGIEWNEHSGDVKFLILDPHYTGSDELTSIQQKPSTMEGYKATACGWRSADSFSKHSFYNLCVPLRPTDII